MIKNRGRFVGLSVTVSIATLGLALASQPASAQQPITISILDNGGDYASTGAIIENYKKAFPNKVKEIKLQRGARAGDCPPRSRRSRTPAGRTSTWSSPARMPGSVLAAHDQLIRLFPTYDKLFPKDDLTDEAKILQDAGGGFLMPTVVNDGGPVFIYNPKKVPNPPKTAAELLAWAKANPKCLLYARPANSGPGRSIMTGIP